MAGAAHLSLERCREARDLDGGGESRGIDFLRRGGEEQIHAEHGRQLRVVRLVPRIAAQVGGVVELCRVHEQRDDDEAGRFPRASHEREMAVVKRAHRRHEADARSRIPGGAHRFTQLRDAAHDLHAASVAGATASLAANTFT